MTMPETSEQKTLTRLIDEIKSVEEYYELRNLLEKKFIALMQEGIDLNDGTDCDVHTGHCCVVHGCKYNDPNCSVETGSKKQSYKCLETSVCYDLKPGYYDNY